MSKMFCSTEQLAAGAATSAGAEQGTNAPEKEKTKNEKCVPKRPLSDPKTAGAKSCRFA